MSHSEVSLQDIATIVQGGRLKLSGQHFVEVGYPAYGAGGVNGYLEHAEFDQPAVVLSSIGARCGKCFLAEGKWTSLANTQVIIPDQQKADVRFLWYQLNNESRWHRSGSAQPFIKPSDVKAHKVYLPSLAEQRRIAAILDKADVLRAKRREAIAKLDQLLQSVFLDMFGDPVANPKGWSTNGLSELGAVHTGRTPPSSKEGMFGGAIPFVTPGDLDCSPLRTARTLTTDGAEHCKVVRAGSALVGCIGNIGKIGRASESSAFNQQINAVEWDSDLIDDEFGVVALRYAVPQMRALASSTTLPILNKSAFSTVKIIVPPLAEQRRFARAVAAIRKNQSVHIASSESMSFLFASLQHRAFTGTL